jgi:hypothetical protein
VLYRRSLLQEVGCFQEVERMSGIGGSMQGNRVVRSRRAHLAIAHMLAWRILPSSHARMLAYTTVTRSRACVRVHACVRVCVRACASVCVYHR